LFLSFFLFFEPVREESKKNFESTRKTAESVLTLQSHTPTRNLLSHALTPQCQKRRNEKKAREREEGEKEREKRMRRSEVKREGTRALYHI
jgi:hypothetical protein